jgi:membrane protease YdiL (CAAX protease family)
VDAIPSAQVVPEASPADEPLYEGTWERSGRSLNAAATAALLGIGVVYVHAQMILAAIAALVGIITGSVEFAAGSRFEFDTLLHNIRQLSSPIRISLLLSQYLFMLIPALWLVRKWHTARVREYIRLTRPLLLEVILAVLATLAILPTGSWIANALTHQLDIPEKFIRLNAEVFTAYSLGEFLWLVFIIAVTPAVCEEVFFRGVVQRTFERTMQWKSVLLIGFLFGLFHMQPLGLITLALLGVLLGYFYYRSRSLLPSMAAHFTNNLVALYVLYRPTEIDGVNLATERQIPVMWVLTSLPVAIALVYFYHLVTRKPMQATTP